MKKRIVSLLLCLCLAVGLLPVSAQEAQGSYVALGDSITTGYGLGEGEKAFPQLLAEANGYALANLGEDGMTSGELLVALQTDQKVQAALAGADVVTITIGGNDLMNALYQGMAAAYSQAAGTEVTAQQLQELLATGAVPAQLLPTLISSVDLVVASQGFANAVMALAENLTAILAGVKALNPDAKLAVSGLYNPYIYLESPLVEPVTKAFESALMAANPPVEELIAAAGASYLDLRSSFGTAEETPFNAKFNSLTDFSLDFHPNAYGHLLAAQAAAQALGLKAPEGEEEEPGFTDVPADQWYTGAVGYVVEHGIMQGMGGGLFAPDSQFTRAEVAQVLYNLAGKPEVAQPTTFADSVDHWAKTPIAWAEQTGVVGGYEDNTFRPDQPISRQEFAVMLYHFADYQDLDLEASGDLSRYPDGGETALWAQTALSWANGKELINGYEDNTIRPEGQANRAVAASILMKFHQNVA